MLDIEFYYISSHFYVQYIRQLHNACRLREILQIKLQFATVFVMNSHALNSDNSISNFLQLGFPYVLVRHYYTLWKFWVLKRIADFCIILWACFLNTIQIPLSF